MNDLFPSMLQEPFHVDVDPTWSKTHGTLDSATKVKRNKTESDSLSNEMQGDDPFAPSRPSGLMVDLDARIERNDEGLVAAYTNLYRFGETDQQTVSTIEALKTADKDIMAYILEVIYRFALILRALWCL